MTRRYGFVSRRYARTQVLVVVLGSICVTELQAQARFDAEQSDKTVQIVGALPADSTLIGTIRIRVIGGGVQRLGFSPSNLSPGASGTTIDRRFIELVGQPTLVDGIPSDLQVKITLPRASAQYQGSVTFVLPGSSAQTTLTLPLTVQAWVIPALIPSSGSDTLRLSLVSCSGASCWLAQQLLPIAAVQDSFPLMFENQQGDPVQVARTIFGAYGDLGGNRMPPDALTLAGQGLSVGPRSVGTGLLRLQRANLAPDRYRGSLYLSLSEQGARLRIPVDISVRMNAWIPLFLLFLGILFGRALKYMNDKGSAQSKALSTFYQERSRVQRLDPRDANILDPMLRDIREAIDQFALANVDADLTAIATRRKTLEYLRQVEPTLGGRPDALALQAQINKIRILVTQKDDAGTATEYSLFRAALGTPPAAGPGAAAVLRTVAPQITFAPAPTLGQRLFKSLAGLSGGFRSEATYWLLRPLLAIVLLLGLVVVGMNTLYAQGAATLGVGHLNDYLGFVLWGLSSDVASRTLANLGTPGHP